MQKEMLSTKEVADYLGIHEKQVYALIKQNKIPCTRATGKWIFPKHLIDEWIIGRASENVSNSKNEILSVEDGLLAAGSNDPILDIILSNIKQKNSDFYIYCSTTGSTDGLKLLSRGVTHIAWCHLFDPVSGKYNIPYVVDNFPSKEITIVHLFYRELGFILSPRLLDTFKNFSDLNKNITFINRQLGSGTRILLDYHLQKENIDTESITGYDHEVYTHFEVGLSVSSGSADAGIATVAVSKFFNLPFIPIIKESFDMVLLQSTFFKKNIQIFIESLNSEKLKKKLKIMDNYDFKDSGKILYP